MPQKMIIGFDPGLSGAMGVIHPEGVAVHDLPTLELRNGKKRKRVLNRITLAGMVRSLVITAQANQWEITMWIEDVHSMPKQGVASMFSMGRVLGNIEMVPAVLGIRHEFVAPQTWKKKMLAGMGKEKDASCYKASAIFPDLEFFGPKGGAKDGRGDAMLIAEYGRLHDDGGHE